jgi:DNA helicase II / ATP-dependent DNA helicase PcrA
VKLAPRETLAQGGRCPVCGGAMTIGVLHRVEALADRGEDEAAPPPGAGEVSNLVPLPEVLGEIAASGPASKTVERGYSRLLSSLGSELAILQSVPLEDISRAGSSLLAEGIARLRAGKVICDAGYDGEYGVVRLFGDAELRQRTAGAMLFERDAASPPASRGRQAPNVAGEDSSTPAVPAGRHLTAPRSTSPVEGEAKEGGNSLASLDDDQRAAASIVEGPLLIVAGPGSGKTRTLVHRLVHLVKDCGVAGERCLAITFTRRAAAEMEDRLRQSLSPDARAIAIHTFHSLGLAMLREHASTAGLERGFRVVGEAERAAALAAKLGLPVPRAGNLIRAISKAERAESGTPAGEAAETRDAYRQLLAANNWIDFDDLVGLPVRLLATNADIAALYRDRFRFVAVDEFQDVDARQYRFVTLLAPPPAGNLCIIGDPQQAIYGFRGADAACFERFRSDYAAAAAVTLKRNYRSSGTIVAASSQIIAARGEEPIAEMVRERHERITIYAAPSERAEAEFVVATIEEAIGGHSFFSIDSGRADGRQATGLSFADLAVLYRTEAQAAALTEALARSGIPFRKHSHAALAQEPTVRALLEALAVIEAPDAGLAARLGVAADRVAAPDGDRAAVEFARQQLLRLAESCDGDEARFLDAVALASDADFWDERADAVALLTLHAAKGLEFACVFIVGLEDGVLPLHWGRPEAITPEDLAEERRLFYVGMTRAKDRLVLSRALKRLWRGRVREQAPSPFLADIESELLKQQKAALPRKPRDRQLRLF